MVYCAAINCANKPRKDKKYNEKRNYYCFPRPEKEKERFRQWLHNIGRSDWTLSNFTWNRNKTVCSDHFHPSCLQENRMAQVMPDYLPKTHKITLKPGSIPTIFKHKVYDVININGEVAETERVAKRREEKERKEVSQLTIIEVPKGPIYME